MFNNTVNLAEAEVLALELAAARAWPAAEIVEISEWKWRFSGGGSRRANSVLPLAFNGANIDAAIEDVEARYRERGNRAYFQVSSIAAPADLDVRLAARGYTYEEPCLLMAKRLGGTSIPTGVLIATEPTSRWLSIYTELLDPTRRAAAPATLRLVPEPCAYFLAHSDGEPVATALGVASGKIALVECVATRSDRRRSGAARLVMQALEAWSLVQGASIIGLQVVEGNVAGRALYASLGYGEVGRYHYRWRDLANDCGP